MHSIVICKSNEFLDNFSDFYANKEAKEAINDDYEVEVKETESNGDNCRSNDFRIFDDNRKSDENNFQGNDPRGVQRYKFYK